MTFLHFYMLVLFLFLFLFHFFFGGNSKNGIELERAKWNSFAILNFFLFFLTIQDVDTYSYFINRKLFRCIRTTSLEQQQQQQQQASAHNFVDVILFRSVGCCWLDFLYNSIINRLIDRIWFFWDL